MNIKQKRWLKFSVMHSYGLFAFGAFALLFIKIIWFWGQLAFSNGWNNIVSMNQAQFVFILLSLFFLAYKITELYIGISIDIVIKAWEELKNGNN